LRWGGGGERLTEVAGPIHHGTMAAALEDA
jgi:hypothetical protein